MEKAKAKASKTSAGDSKELPRARETTASSSSTPKQLQQPVARPRGRPPKAVATEKETVISIASTGKPAGKVLQISAQIAKPVRARNAVYDKFNSCLDQHNANNDIFVVQFDDGEIQAWKPTAEHFDLIQSLAAFYEYPLDSSTRLFAQAADKKKYEATIKFIVSSEKDAASKMERLKAIAKASKKKRGDVPSSVQKAAKAQRNLSADLQTAPTEERTPRSTQTGSDLIDSASALLVELEEEYPGITKTPSTDSELFVVPSPSKAPSRKRELSPIPESSAVKKVAPSSGGFNASPKNTGKFSFMPKSKITGPSLMPKDKLSSKLGAPVPKPKTVAPVKTKKIAAVPKVDSADEEFQWPFEVSTDKIPLNAKLAGKKIYIDEAFLEYLRTIKPSKGTLVRLVCARLLLGPDRDMTGIRMYYEMREEMRARNEKPPGICDFLGEHFMLNLRLFIGGCGFDSSGSWISKTLGAWKDEMFKANKAGWADETR